MFSARWRRFHPTSRSAARGATVAFAYVAAASHLVTELLPYDWYMALVLEGARYRGFPDADIATLRGAGRTPDPSPGGRGGTRNSLNGFGITVLVDRQMAARRGIRPRRADVWSLLHSASGNKADNQTEGQ